MPVRALPPFETMYCCASFSSLNLRDVERLQLSVMLTKFYSWLHLTMLKWQSHISEKFRSFSLSIVESDYPLQGLLSCNAVIVLMIAITCVRTYLLPTKTLRALKHQKKIVGKNPRLVGFQTWPSGMAICSGHEDREGRKWTYISSVGIVWAMLHFYKVNFMPSHLYCSRLAYAFQLSVLRVEEAPALSSDWPGS